MKIARRIIAVIVLLSVVIFIGYLVFTGSRFNPENASQFAQKIIAEVSNAKAY